MAVMTDNKALSDFQFEGITAFVAQVTGAPLTDQHHQLRQSLDALREFFGVRPARALLWMGIITAEQVLHTTAAAFPEEPLNTEMLTAASVEVLPVLTAQRLNMVAANVDREAGTVKVFVDAAKPASDPVGVAEVEKLAAEHELRVLWRAARHQHLVSALDSLDTIGRGLLGQTVTATSSVEQASRNWTALVAPAPAPGSSPEQMQQLQRMNDVMKVMVNYATLREVSDIHVGPDTAVDATGMKFEVRLDGVLQEIPEIHHLSQADGQALIRRLTNAAGMGDGSVTFATGAIDLRTDSGARYSLRLEAAPIEGRGGMLTMRVQYQDQSVTKSLSDIFPPRETDLAVRMERLISASSNGLILLAGSTGDGKSTTMAALLSTIDMTRKRVVTIENPVEFRIPGARQLSFLAEQRTFAGALRAFLRHDPDVIMVGEIRDDATAEVAFDAASTGHLVLSTVHAAHTGEVPGRLETFGVERWKIADLLIGAISQKLVRTLCSNCNVGTGKPVGCEFCDGTGVRGRAAVAEVLRVNESVRDLITQHARPSVIAGECGIRIGDHAVQLMDQGRTTEREVVEELGDEWYTEAIWRRDAAKQQQPDEQTTASA